MVETNKTSTYDNKYSTQPTGGIIHVIPRPCSQQWDVYGVICQHYAQLGHTNAKCSDFVGSQ